jgi:hypothetical protein
MTKDDSTDNSEAAVFRIKDCALVAIATGKKAQSLRELKDILIDVDAGSIYYHFWGGLLRPRFDDPEYHNDFAAWARHALHDSVLAERLSVITPTEFQDLEGLRQELVEVIEDRLDEIEIVPWARADEQFAYIRSQIVVFNTHKELRRPRELSSAVPHMSVGSIFYHFIDARRRTEDRIDDFCEWLKGLDGDHDSLCADLMALDPYFSTLVELRDRLSELFGRHFES